MDAPGEKLLIRLWDTIENLFGGLVSPWQARRTGRARLAVRREEKLALAQADRDIEDIRSGRKHFTDDHRLVEGSQPDGNTFSRDDSTVAALATMAQRNLLAQQMRAELNVAKALVNAEDDLADDSQEPPDRRIDEDWFFRWRDSASTVSDEELQALWGRVLAGEVKSPGTFSLRTLEFLKNVSKEEAQRIEKLAPFVVDNEFVFRSDGSPLKSEGITPSFVMSLGDLGIVDSASARGVVKRLRSAEPNAFKLGLVSYTRVLVVTHSDPKKETRLDIYRLTSLGREVLRLGAFTPHDGYLRHLGQTIRDRGFNVVLARYQRVTETVGHYFDEEQL